MRQFRGGNNLPSYLEFEVSLRGIKPRLWRRFQIADDATFGDLHRAIRDSFGWHGGHLWEFMNNSHEAFAAFAHEFQDVGFDEPPPDAEEVKLLGYFPRARSCVYYYDFGDSWMHSVRLRDRVTSSEQFHRRLLAGRRACPPEDCGGVGGYYRFVSIVETGVDPWEEDVTELLEWLGEWDPSEFDLKLQKRIFDTVEAPEDLF